MIHLPSPFITPQLDSRLLTLDFQLSTSFVLRLSLIIRVILVIRGDLCIVTMLQNGMV